MVTRPGVVFWKIAFPIPMSRLSRAYFSLGDGTGEQRANGRDPGLVSPCFLQSHHLFARSSLMVCVTDYRFCHPHGPCVRMQPVKHPPFRPGTARGVGADAVGDARHRLFRLFLFVKGSATHK